MKKNIIIAVAVAGIVALSASAQAGSPKGDAQEKASQKVEGTTPDLLDHSAKSGSPKGRQQAEASLTVISTNRDTDYVHATRPTLAPKDAGFAAAWNAVAEYQVAPLK